MIKLNHPIQHNICEPLKLLKQILEKMLVDVRINKKEKFSKEKMQRINRLYLMFNELLQQVKKQELLEVYEFFTRAESLVDQIVMVRDDLDFVAMAAATDVELMPKLDLVVMKIYEIVYSEPVVKEFLGNAPHVAKRLAMITDKTAGQKVVDELWEKVRKAELASHEADKKLSAAIKEIQAMHDMQDVHVPVNFSAEFHQLCLEAHLLGAAATLALAELAEAKAHLAKL